MHAMRFILGCLLVSILVVRAASPAMAGPSIVIESYEGKRPPDADDRLRPVYAALTRRGFVGGQALADQIERSISRSPGDLTATGALEAQEAVARGYQAFIDGDYTGAVSAMEKALARYAEAPGPMAREPALRDLQFKALIVSGRSHEVLGHGEDAFRAIAEAIRTFPDRHVSTAEFDPKVNALFRRVRAELSAQKAGSLDIEVDDPSATIFVNERYVGTGSTTVSDLPPGLYRVYVAKGADAPGRVHDVRIDPGASVPLSIHWALDAGLQSRDQYVALALGDRAGGEHEIALATRLARALDARSVVILGIRDVDKRRSVVGYAVQTDSQTKVYGAVQLEPAEPAIATLSNLGALLAGDRSADTTHIVTQEPRPAVMVALPTRDRPAPWYTDHWGWGLTGAGATLTGVGAWILWSADQLQKDANHEPGQSARQELRDRASTRLWTGSAVFAAGAAVLVSGVIKLVRSDSAVEGPTTAARTEIIVSPNGIAIEGSF